MKPQLIIYVVALESLKLAAYWVGASMVVDPPSHELSTLRRRRLELVVDFVVNALSISWPHGHTSTYREELELFIIRLHSLNESLGSLRIADLAVRKATCIGNLLGHPHRERREGAGSWDNSCSPRQQYSFLLSTCRRQA